MMVHKPLPMISGLNSSVKIVFKIAIISIIIFFLNYTLIGAKNSLISYAVY